MLPLINRSNPISLLLNWTQDGIEAQDTNEARLCSQIQQFFKGNANPNLRPVDCRCAFLSKPFKGFKINKSINVPMYLCGLFFCQLKMNQDSNGLLDINVYESVITWLRRYLDSPLKTTHWYSTLDSSP